jgi:hypothetical protein
VWETDRLIKVTKSARFFPLKMIPFLNNDTFLPKAGSILVKLGEQM